MNARQESVTLTLGKRRRMYIPFGFGGVLGVEPGDRLVWVIEDTAVWLVNPMPTPEGTYHTALVTKVRAEGDGQPQDRQRMAERFRQRQEGDTWWAIVDPVAWQREQRKERR